MRDSSLLTINNICFSDTRIVHKIINLSMGIPLNFKGWQNITNSKR
jgi:hypothetical protein